MKRLYFSVLLLLGFFIVFPLYAQESATINRNIKFAYPHIATLIYGRDQSERTMRFTLRLFPFSLAKEDLVGLDAFPLQVPETVPVDLGFQNVPYRSKTIEERETFSGGKRVETVHYLQTSVNAYGKSWLFRIIVKQVDLYDNESDPVLSYTYDQVAAQIFETVNGEVGSLQKEKMAIAPIRLELTDRQLPVQVPIEVWSQGHGIYTRQSAMLSFDLRVPVYLVIEGKLLLTSFSCRSSEIPLDVIERGKYGGFGGPRGEYTDLGFSDAQVDSDWLAFRGEGKIESGYGEFLRGDLYREYFYLNLFPQELEANPVDTESEPMFALKLKIFEDGMEAMPQEDSFSDLFK